MSQVGAKIKQRREELEMSQEELAKKLGYKSKSTIGKIEIGINDVAISKIVAFADALDTTPSYLLGWTETRKKSNKIPVLGTVQAGIPIDAIEDIIDYEELDPAMLNHGEEYFALKVKGSSMEPRMREGDVVIVKKQSDVNHDDIAIVLVGDGEATIKRVLKSESGIILAPNNPAFETKFYSNKEIEELPVTVLGKVIELRAKF